MLRRCLIERDKKGQEKGQLTRSPWHLFLAGKREGKPFAAECSLGWGGGEQYTLLESPYSAAKQNSIGRRWSRAMSGSRRGPLAGLWREQTMPEEAWHLQKLQPLRPVWYLQFGTLGLATALVAGCLHLPAPASRPVRVLEMEEQR